MYSRIHRRTDMVDSLPGVVGVGLAYLVGTHSG